MKRKLPNITSKIWSCSAIVFILIVWQIVSATGLVDSFMLPSPVQVVKAFITEFPTLMEHSLVTLAEAFIGLAFGVWASALISGTSFLGFAEIIKLLTNLNEKNK